MQRFLLAILTAVLVAGCWQSYPWQLEPDADVSTPDWPDRPEAADRTETADTEDADADADIPDWVDAPDTDADADIPD
ncbi:MAG: hypothetical protein GYA57_06960, partial [Myxococcales bacterium]|nr:hypothetical protein [Myxococcales bacterium]